MYTPFSQIIWPEKSLTEQTSDHVFFSIFKSKTMTGHSKPTVGLIMGSQSDWKTMRHAAEILEYLKVPFEKKIVSAHRTPQRMVAYAESARQRGIVVIIAGAGGAAHLPGMTAALTSIPVLGVPVESRALKGLDSLLSIAQMPAGIPVGALAVGDAGATNAGLLAAAIMALHDQALAKRLDSWRSQQTKRVAQRPQDSSQQSKGQPVTAHSKGGKRGKARTTRNKNQMK